LNRRAKFALALILVLAAGTIAVAQTIEVTAAGAALEFSDIAPNSQSSEASVLLRVDVTGMSVSPANPIDVYVYLNTSDALMMSGKNKTLATSNLKFKDDAGQWQTPSPLIAVAGALGVRIAVVTSVPSSPILCVRLRVSSHQAAGNYQGYLTVKAQARTL
jgi:hypothetical protein